MNNRIPDYLPAPRPVDQPSQPPSPELRNVVQQKFVFPMHQVNAYVKEHPVTAIVTAFCIGIFLGWVIKRR